MNFKRTALLLILLAIFMPANALHAAKKKTIEQRVASMTLDEKIGQMMIIGFEKPYADAHIKEMIRKYKIGGVNLLRRNVGTKAQVKQLTKDLQKITASVTDVPFMVAVDQEGGKFSRFDYVKNAKTQKSLVSVDDAFIEASRRAKELKDLGVTLNFSPVADFVTDKDSYLYSRTFATSSEAIAGLANAMLAGYKAGGIVGTLKHFPGYGNIMKDPHKNSAAYSDAKIFEESLEPFKKVLAGRNDLAVMTAHIVVPQVDSMPATLSSKFVKGILREQWKFDGVIITDDLEMASVGTSSVPQLAVKAIQAGNDMIISTYTSRLHPKIHAAIKAAVRKGEIDEKEIDKSVARVLRLKGY